MAAEVVRLASHTAEIVLGFFLTDSPQHTALWRQLERGACYFIAPRWPPSLRAVITQPRRGCPACSALTSPAQARPSVTGGWTLGDLSIAGALASTVLWHHLVPGLDAITTIAFVGVAGLWWRDRLPSYRSIAERVRRWWMGP